MTQNDVERSFFTYVKNGVIGKTIKGSVIRGGDKRKDAATEDAVVSCIAISYGQTQMCDLGVCIYVPNMRRGGCDSADLSRIGELETAAVDFAGNFAMDDWSITGYETERNEVEDIRQHTLTVRLHLRRISDDY